MASSRNLLPTQYIPIVSMDVSGDEFDLGLRPLFTDSNVKLGL